MRFFVLSIAFSTLFFSGCSTVDFRYKEGVVFNEIDDSSNTKGVPKTEHLYVGDWLSSAFEIYNVTACEPVKEADNYRKLMCFEKNIQEKDKVSLRNQFVHHAIIVSNNNCSNRVDLVDSASSIGDTTASSLIDLSSAVGAVATDSLTSRIASGVSGGANSLWGHTKSNFIAGAQFATAKGNMQKIRAEKLVSYEAKLFDEKTKTATPYAKWPLAQAVSDMRDYDQACDLFQ